MELEPNELQVELDLGHITYIRCCNCGKLHSVVRSYHWYGKKKNKRKPLPNLLLCIECEKNIWDLDR